MEYYRKHRQDRGGGDLARILGFFKGFCDPVLFASYPAEEIEQTISPDKKPKMAVAVGRIFQNHQCSRPDVRHPTYPGALRYFDQKGKCGIYNPLRFSLFERTKEHQEQDHRDHRDHVRFVCYCNFLKNEIKGGFLLIVP